MTITFHETELQDGYLQIHWDASTKREFQRVLETVKGMIPKQYRAWVPETAAWTLAPEALDTYNEIKQMVADAEAGERLGELVDDRIHDKAVLGSVDYDLRDLPDCMKERAVYAIEAAMGRIDTSVQFSLSRGLFGAWHEEQQRWLYQDGRYSSYSPAEWDDKALATAYRQLERSRDKLDEYLGTLDDPDEEHWKQRLRLDMLEASSHRCYVCRERPDNLRNLHMHRVMPGKYGGQYIESNVVILCVKCHKRCEGQPRSTIDQAREEHLWGLVDAYYDPGFNEAHDPDACECYDPEVTAP